MKQIIFTLSVLLFTLSGYAQIVTSNPAFITQDYAGNIEIIYDATQGSAGLKDLTGDVYAHAGVITDKSASGSDWKYVITPWPDGTNANEANTAKNKLTALGNNKHKLVITGGVQAYFGVAASDKVQKIALVFRNADGAKTGKTASEGDIFIDVYEAGLNVSFTAPASNQTTTAGGSVSFTVTASQAADLKLSVNGANVKTESASVTLSHTQSFPSANDYMMVAEASLSGASVYDTLYVCVPKAVETAARPANAKDGINYVDNSTVTFVMYAPGKSRVNLVGDFSDWTQLNKYQLKKDGDYWWYTLTDVAPGKCYKFQYLVDESLRVSDAYTELTLDGSNDSWISSEIYPNLPAYPSKTTGLVATFQTAKPAYSWEIPNFAMPPRENMVIYELLLRDFTAEKSLDAAIARLNYLKTLGVTAIELMPVQEFDGNNSWGYNPNHFFAPDKAYGSPETYKKFIDECHKRGMAVILDVVFNHATGQHPFAALYWNSATNKTASNNPWFNVDAPHPYSVFHDFNHEFSGTRDYFKRVLRYWIEEYNIDGYRLDLTKGFTQKSSSESTASNYDQSRIDILTDYYNAAKAAKSDVMFILEHFCVHSEELELANKGIYLWRNVNNAFSQAAMGYQSDSDFGGMNATPRRWVGFAESHDEERNFYKAKMWGAGTIASDSVVRIKRVPLNIAFATLTPGPKMIWQFGELGYDYSIDYNGGRTNEKPTALGWINLEHRREAYFASAAAINLRKQFPSAFINGEWSLHIAYNDWANGRRIGLAHTDLNMLVLGNFNADNSITAYPNFPKTGIWYELITGNELNVTDVNMTFSMPAGELRIYTDRKVNVPNSDGNTAAPKHTSVYPSITGGKVFIDPAGSNVAVYNLQGALLKTERNVSETDLSHFPCGLYFIKLKTSEGESIHKIIRK
ncbi:MAG: T9SS type A sorting domain-containing protein [Prevotellaceae bacterium]|jgi:glycosidase|nr:T9SS type A sorting domain-containing protein [Prevotellaceae bacterium]